MKVRTLLLSALLFLSVAVICQACAPPPIANATSPPDSPTQALSPTQQDPAACIPNYAGSEAGKVIRTRIINFHDIVMDVLIGEEETTVHYIGIRVSEWDISLSIRPMHDQLVRGQEVRLVKDTSNQDQRGSLLRYVFFGEHFINYELVRQGFAEAVSQPPDEACDKVFHQAMQAAQSKQIGIWVGWATPGKNPEP